MKVYILSGSGDGIVAAYSNRRKAFDAAIEYVKQSGEEPSKPYVTTYAEALKKKYGFTVMGNSTEADIEVLDIE